MDATDTRSDRRAVNELIPQPLMIPLAMIMGDKPGDGSPKMTLTDGKSRSRHSS